MLQTFYATCWTCGRAMFVYEGDYPTWEKVRTVAAGAGWWSIPGGAAHELECPTCRELHAREGYAVLECVRCDATITKHNVRIEDLALGWNWRRSETAYGYLCRDCQEADGPTLDTVTTATATLTGEDMLKALGAMKETTEAPPPKLSDIEKLAASIGPWRIGYDIATDADRILGATVYDGAAEAYHAWERVYRRGEDAAAADKYRACHEERGAEPTSSIADVPGPKPRLTFYCQGDEDGDV